MVIRTYEYNDGKGGRGKVITNRPPPMMWLCESCDEVALVRRGIFGKFYCVDQRACYLRRTAWARRDE